MRRRLPAVLMTRVPTAERAHGLPGARRGPGVRASAMADGSERKLLLVTVADLGESALDVLGRLGRRGEDLRAALVPLVRELRRFAQEGAHLVHALDDDNALLGGEVARPFVLIDEALQEQRVLPVLDC